MNNIKEYNEFINEGKGLSSFLGGILTGNITAKDLGFDGEEDGEGTETTVPADGSYEPVGDYNPVGGNDDFALYMQHQQGLAGAKGLVQAMLGTGRLHPETIKTKGGVKYANLVQNVPSDKPQVKKDIIAALDKGDQRTAAALFMNTWKQKWFDFQKRAKTEINNPKNKEVKDAITKAAAKNKIPFDFAVTVATIESGLNPKAGNSTYKGLFAMRPNSNYGGVVKPMGSKWSDPYVNAENGTLLLKDNIRGFKKSLGNDWASLNVGSCANYV